jgi:alpha-tubulin suppressor-like RCC1 family protein
MAYNIIYDSSNISILHDINFGRNLNKNVNNNYYTVETVRSELYFRDKSTDISSNLIAQPYLESGERMYPPSRLFTTNNLDLSNNLSPYISCGWNYSLFITSEGKVFSCGLNDAGQLGLNNLTNQTTPQAISTLNSFTISASSGGESHTMFLTNDGKVYSCGNNDHGKLGLNDTTQRNVPTLITTNIGTLTISAVACGRYHTVFLTNNGKVYSCGYNDYGGQLGLGDTTSRSVPTLISTNIGTLTISAVACGGGHTVFLTNDGKVFSCGLNNYGQLGLGNTTSQNTPQQILALNSLTISAIACGGRHTMFLTNDGKVYCCGANFNGELGLGNTTSHNTPQQISALNSFAISAIACGYSHTLFLTNDGKVYTCGSNTSGQLGLSLATTTPTIISTNIGSLTISAITGGDAHSLFLTNDGKVYSCGRNTSGQLGQSLTTITPSIISSGIGSLIIGLVKFVYGSGIYNVSYSSFTSSYEPFRCFNESYTSNNEAIWRTGDYLSTGLFDSATYNTSNLVSGYNGDWLVIKLPLSIKLKRFVIKQINSDLISAPRNFRLYGSTNGTSWTLLIDKQGASYTNLLYNHTDMSQYASDTNKKYNHFGLVVNALVGNSTVLSFDELFIYGTESVIITPITYNDTKTLMFTSSSEPSLNSYNITFPVPTMTDFNNNSNIILQGDYDINLTSTGSQIIPKTGKNIPLEATSNFSPTLSLRYHLLNPIAIGAQWTYNSSNTNVYYLGNVGVGTADPKYNVDITGDIRITGDLYKGTEKFKASNWTSNINGILSYSNVAIGKELVENSPYKLDVGGNIGFSGSINDITSNELHNLKNINYNIKQRIDSNDSNQSNYILATSNILSTQILNLNADNITSGTQNKFIINNIYNGNLTINSNLTVLGTSTTLNTDVYTTERLEISNTNPTSTAFEVNQIDSATKILSAFTTGTSKNEIFTISTNGRVGINKTTPEYNLDITGDIRITGDLYKGAEKIKGSNWTSNINGILSYSNVAIGKELVASSPHKLDVGGNINFSGDLYKNNLIFKASNWTSNIDGILSYSNVAIGKELVASSPHKLDVGGNIKFSGDLYKNINNNNYAIETVRSELYFKDKSITTTSNLIAEPYLESGERMYPPSRLFTTNNLTLTESFVSIKAVGEHTLFITKTGEVFSCGNNDEGQLGLGDRTNRTTLQLISSLNSLTISAVEGGRQHTVFITNEGKVYSCGYNYYGQLGLGNTIRQTTPQLISTNIGTLTISAIVCGYAHTVFLTNDGKVYSCGYNGQGRLGLGDTSDRSVPTLITALNSLTISAIACGSAHTVFLTNDGKVYSCGYNFYGELGLGNKTEQTTPQLITALNSLTISAIACGREHTVFITNEGKVYSCGDNDYGQLGLGNTSQQTTPQPITALNLLTISAIECGIVHTVFLTNDGKVYSCGYNLYGQLGLGNKTQQTTPQLITALDSLTISAIACGSAHTVFITNNNKVYACGYNIYGQLGLGNTTESYTTPFIMPYSTSSTIYGSGLYTISYSSFTTSFEPFKCFNEDSTANNQGTWRSGDYLSTGLFDSTTYSTSNLVSGYNGDWLVIKLPLSIKLKKFVIKQISSDLISAPRNFRLYGSTNGTSWTLLIDKQNASYTSLLYTHTDMSQYASDANKYYNHFGLVVSALVGSATTLSFDELFIYGKESVITTSITNNDTKTLSISSTSSTSYNITFPVPTMTDFNNNSNIILQGEYDINLTSTGSQIIPKTGKNIPLEATSNFSPSLSLRYHLLNPIKINEGAQWIYNSYNTNVYYLGNVGIGRTDPEYNLDITGDVRITGDLYKGAEKIKGSNWTSNIDGILSYSNVAIGKELVASSPHKLDVGGNINFSGDLYKNNLIFKASNWTSNIDGILSYSNVAIGKELVASSPHKLDVGGNINFSGDLYKNNLIFKASNWTSNIDGILSYSNVAIGKELVASSPHKLDVGGSINISTGSKYKINGANLSYSDLEGSLPTGSSQWITSNNNIYYNVGNVGINITDPIEKLDVNGNIRSSGSITSFSSFSDERLKDREGNIENPIDIVDKLQGFYYRPNKTANNLGIQGNKRELGISAQDVQKILPELVNIAPADIAYDEEKNIISKTGSNYLTVNYEKMIPLLIESIKELNKNINDLKKENIELRDLIKSQ